MLSYRGFTVYEWWRLLSWWFIHHGPRRDVTVDTFNGLLTFDSGNWLIGKYLYVKKAHEEHEIEGAVGLVKSLGLLKRKGTVLNVGANIGMTCIALVKGGFFERAVAFEPAPENFRLLVWNIKQNGLDDRIQSFGAALSSADGNLEMELSKDNPGDHRIRSPTSRASITRKNAGRFKYLQKRWTALKTIGKRQST